ARRLLDPLDHRAEFSSAPPQRRRALLEPDQLPIRVEQRGVVSDAPLELINLRDESIALRGRALDLLDLPRQALFLAVQPGHVILVALEGTGSIRGPAEPDFEFLDAFVELGKNLDGVGIPAGHDLREPGANLPALVLHRRELPLTDVRR